MKRLVAAITALSLLGGCGVFGGDKKPSTPTVGTRIAVLAAESDVEVDPALASIPVTIPPAVTNTEWSQPGGNAAKSMIHLTLGQTLGRAFAIEIGEGSSNRGGLAASPVVAGGRIYTIDTLAVVRSFDAETGARVWEAGVGKPEDRRGGVNFLNGEPTGNRILLYGGGVSFDNGRVYATSGIGDVAALDAATGAEIWRVRPGGPLRGAPTVANENVYVVSQDNQLYALNPADGAVRWSEAGAAELAGVFGTAAPSAAQGTVVVGFSSGELNAYRYENGQTLWQDALTRTSISTTVGSLSDIDADPVIADGRVYAIGQGGRMVAIELNSGQRIWEINVAGISTPWAAGEWIYVVTDQAQLLAISRATGKVRWMTQLQRWRDEKDKQGPIQWVGPILAGDRLVLANSRGHITNVSPVDGSIQSTVDTEMPVSLQPVVANNTLYILHDNGRLTAWR
jgi:outer membrane protein assembly factor BamB